jgi:putative transposase
MNTRNRTPSKCIGYGLYLYFLGLSFRNAAKALSFLQIVNRSHVSIWKWIQKYKPKKISMKRTQIQEYIIDETIIKVGSEYIWLWVAIEQKDKEILSISLLKKETCS